MSLKSKKHEVTWSTDFGEKSIRIQTYLEIFFPEILVFLGLKFETNLYLVFRGTQLGNLESIKKDLLTDLKFKQRQAAYLTDESRVHTGFDAGYMSVRWVQV